jgi:hypothetical protein
MRGIGVLTVVMPGLIRHPPFLAHALKEGRPRIKSGVTVHFFSSAGFTQGLNAPPGTAEATGLS